jgi:acyl phosphate:glycerol-3-phosphate acyltransferase
MDFSSPLNLLLLSTAFILGAYLMGSVSFAVLISRALGLGDPRDYGSGNPGATNVLRSGHKLAALLTLLCDALKGAVPVWLLQSMDATAQHECLQVWVACVGFAAFVGHLWPIFFKLCGGKGVATAAGVLLAFNPGLGLLAVATWLLVAMVSRYSSLAALTAALLVPFYQWLIWQHGQGSNMLCAIVGMSALLVWRHRSNIKKLLAGTESRLGRKQSTSAAVLAPHQAHK